MHHDDYNPPSGTDMVPFDGHSDSYPIFTQLTIQEDFLAVLKF